MLNCVKTGREAIEECSLTNLQMETFDIRIHSTYVKVSGEGFIICSLFDISNEKRRGVMERIFFHDMMNTINGISGIAHVLPMIEPEKQVNYFSFLNRLTQSLVDDMLSHRLLTMAEKNEYNVAQHQISSLDFVREEVEKYRKIASLEAKEVRITDDSENNDLITDKVLLACVLGNMIKNALEAEPSGALIKVSVLMNDSEFLTISVKNDSVINETDRLKVFKRSFSTKSDKRGLGTYAMKLFTEKYLNGTVSFESREGKGTTFTVQLPVC
jgi:signal transduction histidine kinase